jgi:rhamnulokinase
MAAEAKFLAFDLGAESGRAVVGLFDGEKLRLHDAHRFASRSVRLADTLYWDALGMFHELKQGLSMAVAEHGRDFAGIGIDTWGVDFGLLGRGDVLLGNPRHYRDHGNDGMLEVAFGIVPREQIFDRTGIQFMQLNTLYQLISLQRAKSPLLEQAETLLLMPDLFNFWFTGVKTTEFSIASTTQMVDPRTRSWASDLLDRFGLPTKILTDIVPTAATIGPLRADIAAEAGCGPIQVLAPGEHDTASAIVAVPASTPDYSYISSGTWSLMGIETTEPRISDATRAYNFTNEGGACGTIRLLKNIMGLWLVQECRRAEARQGRDYSYAQLSELASQAEPFGPLIEPDSPEFLAPSDMLAAIAEFCRHTGQPTPAGIGATIRCCLESLALKYRWALERLEEFRGKAIDVIHIVGGGTQNKLLCQLAADATGRQVIAGPVEATATGNVLMQALGRGYISSLDQAREIVRQSFPLETYSPTGARDQWEAAYARFVALRDRIGKTD